MKVIKYFSFSAFLIGMGLGLFLSCFLILNNRPEFNPEKEILKIPDQIVIERAIELGLFDPSSEFRKQSVEEGIKGK